MPRPTGFDCAPDRHVGWRATYLALAATAIIALGTLKMAWVLCLAGAAALGLLLSRDRLAFLGQFATVALLMAVTLALAPSYIATPAASAVGAWEGARRVL